MQLSYLSGLQTGMKGGAVPGGVRFDPLPAEPPDTLISTVIYLFIFWLNETPSHVCRYFIKQQHHISNRMKCFLRKDKSWNILLLQSELRAEKLTGH